MYAVIETGGKQYKVEEGMKLIVEKIASNKGDEVILDKVLLIGSDEKARVGRPLVEGASVIAKVVSQKRSPKVIVFKKRSKKGYKKTIGHRQYITEIEIMKIKA